MPTCKPCRIQQFPDRLQHLSGLIRTVQVSLGNQRRRTKIARLRDRAFSWDESLVFAAAVPITARPFKLLLCEVDRRDQEQRPRPLAIAFISLAQLMAATQESGVSTVAIYLSGVHGQSWLTACAVRRAGATELLRLLLRLDAALMI